PSTTNATAPSRHPPADTSTTSPVTTPSPHARSGPSIGTASAKQAFSPSASNAASTSPSSKATPSSDDHPVVVPPPRDQRPTRGGSAATRPAQPEAIPQAVPPGITTIRLPSPGSAPLNTVPSDDSRIVAIPDAAVPDAAVPGTTRAQPSDTSDPESAEA